MNDQNQRLWIPVAFVVGAAIGIAGMYTYLSSMQAPSPVIPNVPVYAPPTTSVPVVEAPMVTPTEPIAEQPKIPLPEVKMMKSIEGLSIDWTKPKEIDVFAKLDSANKTWDQIVSNEFPTKKGYDIGVVKSGSYKGFHLIKWVWGEEGLGGGEHYIDVLLSADEKTWVVAWDPKASNWADFGESYGDSHVRMTNWMAKSFTLTDEISYQVTTLPDKLTLANGAVLTKTGSWDTDFICTSRFCAEKKVSDTKEGFPIYNPGNVTLIAYGFGSSSVGCVLAFAEDGRAHVYSVLDPGLQRESAGSSIATIPSSQINWNSDLPRSNVEYDPTGVGGCGGHNCAEIVSEQDVNSGGGIVQAGTFLNQPIYIPKHMQDNTVVKTVYEGWLTFDDKKKTLNDFLFQFPIPVFFQKDALGRWVRYQITNAFPQAECGKPVIYLYPETATDVSVKLPRFINVTVSDPQYPSAGWKVTAQPNGSLTSHADGKTYESLYWEGTGVSYQTPTTGWVVKGSEVESFLDRTLAKYGLNAKEASDFKEFWVPRMKSYDLMRVSFLTNDWSKAAPLSVSPAPKTSIRIFMDWQPLSRSIQISEPRVTTPARDGFTLVEWGGTLYR